MKRLELKPTDIWATPEAQQLIADVTAFAHAVLQATGSTTMSAALRRIRSWKERSKR